MEICKRYGIKSTYQLRNWILKYNGHETLKTSGTGGTPIVTKGRATTYNERVEIVKYCIEHQNNYAETAQEFWTFHNNELVFRTFDIAHQTYPNAKPIFHSDRGFQYTSKIFKKKLEDAGMTQSMSRVARCIDNGPMESFWRMMKSEMYYLNKFNTYEELEATVIEYINYYNTQRYQKRLNCMTPLEYRQQHLNRSAA